MVTERKIRFVRKHTTFRVVPTVQSVPQVEPAPAAEVLKYLRFDAQVSLAPLDGKSFEEIKTGDQITDYRNVRVRGYLSTFDNVDRDGEFVEPGAFKKTIAEFMKNPVMLSDHRNQVASMVGSFQVVREDNSGLWVEGTLSNSPETIHARFLVAEGHLKTMSIGGFFARLGNAVKEVALFEGSLTPVPSNPKAIFSVRECTELEAKRWKFEPQGQET